MRRVNLSTNKTQASFLSSGVVVVVLYLISSFRGERGIRQSVNLRKVRGEPFFFRSNFVFKPKRGKDGEFSSKISTGLGLVVVRICSD